MKTAQYNSLRAIPSVEKVLKQLVDTKVPRPMVVEVVRRQLEAFRAEGEIPDMAEIISQIQTHLQQLQKSRIQPVINGTGIVIHTNLGRSPLAKKAMALIQEIGLSYSNLEYDLDTGKRGNRARYLEQILTLLCGAEAATVVNNNAAALILILKYFTKEKKEIIVSRGELIQIGGGFRIPEMLETAGAVLNEVGTTNNTSIQDYQEAISQNTALILRVHHSNFYMDGFVSSPKSQELATLAAESGIPFVEDQGSGAIGLPKNVARVDQERDITELLQSGADLVCCSADKLLGGPQAGIIFGRQDYIISLKKEPIYRALRCDKLFLAALQATVESYLEGTQERDIPTRIMFNTSKDELTQRAKKLVGSLPNLPSRIEIGLGMAKVGGGAMPRTEIESVTLDIIPFSMTLDEIATSLRAKNPSVIGYIDQNRYKIDLRTVFPAQDNVLARSLVDVFDLPNAALPDMVEAEQ